jgi:hypothetical protein
VALGSVFCDSARRREGRLWFAHHACCDRI